MGSKKLKQKLFFENASVEEVIASAITADDDLLSREPRNNDNVGPLEIRAILNAHLLTLLYNSFHEDYDNGLGLSEKVLPYTTSAQRKRFMGTYVPRAVDG